MKTIGRVWLASALLLACIPAPATAEGTGPSPGQPDAAGSQATSGGATGQQPPGRIDAPDGTAPGGTAPGAAGATRESSTETATGTGHLPRPWRVGESCSSGDVGVGEARICVSSVLDPQFGNRYGGGNLGDRKMRTAWVEGVSGNGIGEFVTLAFDRPVPVSRIEIANGYNKSPSIFRKNARVREFTVAASNGFTRRIRLSDKRGWQTLNLPPLGAVTWIMLKVESVYPGIKYTDTAVSEIALQ